MRTRSTIIFSCVGVKTCKRPSWAAELTQLSTTQRKRCVSSSNNFPLDISLCTHCSGGDSIGRRRACKATRSAGKKFERRILQGQLPNAATYHKGTYDPTHKTAHPHTCACILAANLAILVTRERVYVMRVDLILQSDPLMAVTRLRGGDGPAAGVVPALPAAGWRCHSGQAIRSPLTDTQNTP